MKHRVVRVCGMVVGGPAINSICRHETLLRFRIELRKLIPPSSPTAKVKYSIFIAPTTDVSMSSISPWSHVGVLRAVVASSSSSYWYAAISHASSSLAWSCLYHVNRHWLRWEKVSAYSWELGKYCRLHVSRRYADLCVYMLARTRVSDKPYYTLLQLYVKNCYRRWRLKVVPKVLAVGSTRMTSMIGNRKGRCLKINTLIGLGLIFIQYTCFDGSGMQSFCRNSYTTRQLAIR